MKRWDLVGWDWVVTQTSSGRTATTHSSCALQHAHHVHCTCSWRLADITCSRNPHTMASVLASYLWQKAKSRRTMYSVTKLYENWFLLVALKKQSRCRSKAQTNCWLRHALSTFYFLLSTLSLSLFSISLSFHTLSLALACERSCAEVQKVWWGREGREREAEHRSVPLIVVLSSGREAAVAAPRPLPHTRHSPLYVGINWSLPFSLHQMTEWSISHLCDRLYM